MKNLTVNPYRPKSCYEPGISCLSHKQETKNLHGANILLFVTWMATNTNIQSSKVSNLNKSRCTFCWIPQKFNCIELAWICLDINDSNRHWNIYIKISNTYFKIIIFQEHTRNKFNIKWPSANTGRVKKGGLWWLDHKPINSFLGLIWRNVVDSTHKVLKVWGCFWIPLGHQTLPLGLRQQKI